ncbi:adenylate/guanylate cyclase domain-containing protein [Croceitalea rosinachiae]|uniref:Adenylate/guanylate cyclase domain-containing protein n=1 Tax=Croceitalea rosinachiae TaxID=3075596 RepID=A0ABU3AAU3_9FLAO|nr:adenylate/guanylate cyclase domain-containing protein [Croceitalea sp. F388]MDT0607094.1 adenylate/guanylate cyclase domain-containing protein [Croceitalea sp. F388]
MNSKTSFKALRQILQRDATTKALIEDLSKKIEAAFCIEANNETILWGNKGSFKSTIDLEHENEILATFHYNESRALSIFETIKILFQKEWEKKKIGKEVLGLYREINMIYGLSEMISEKIDATSIAEVALNEATQIINTTHGLFLMYDAETDNVVQIAQFGDNPSSQENINKQKEVLKELIKRGTSAIVPTERVSKNPALSHLKTVMYAPLKVKHRTLGMVILGHEDEIEYTAAELKLLTTIALQSSSAIESAHLYQKGLQEVQAREEAIRKIHDASQKFVPSEFIKSLGKAQITEVVLGDLAEKEVTVVFADIRDFTTISENLDPKDNFLFVNGFNNRMGPIIRKNGGFIMQYLGDGFMALFPEGPQGALNASVEMHQVLHDYNQERAAKKRLPVKIGIGMQNGKLIMGITGDTNRLDAAIISDTVNTASRIEGLSKHYGASILLTDSCKAKLKSPEHFNFRYLGAVMVKGKQKPIDLYECINGDSPKLLSHKLDTSATFQKGLDLYLNKEFAMAAVTFQRIFKLNKQDATAKLFLNKSAHLITQELGEDWKGIHSMSTK